MSMSHHAGRRRLLLGAAAGLWLATGAARAHDDHAGHDAHAGHGGAPAAPTPSSATVRGLDATLVDQDGRSVNLRRDVIGDRIAVVDFVYTSCTTVCPLASAMFSQLQSLLGEDLGRDVVLVTLTVDPVRDTPQRLKEYARRYEAKAGWTWLTGPSVAVDDVLKGMGAYAPDFTQHPLMVLVGDATNNRWVRLSGTPDPQVLLAQVKQIRQARRVAQARTGG
jgi:protein SCO1/2